MNTDIWLFLIATGLGVLGWILHKVGQVLLKLLEAAAVIAGVFAAIWLAVRSTWKAGRWVATHWRTTLAIVAVATWCRVLGWPSLAIAVATVATILATWRWAHLATFEPWAGRYLRGWWLRWMLYSRKLPGWMRACGLSVTDPGQAMTVQLSLLRRTPMAPRSRPRPEQLPRITGVRSGASWDEVTVRLVPGQTPEDFDEAARALAVARRVARCQVRELAPDVVSIDFQRRDLLAAMVSCLDLATLAEVSGRSVDLHRVWAGATEYGTDWRIPMRGGHTLTCGATGAGKNSITWSPLVSIASAIRDGLVRVSAIDPKGMELAYGRRIFHRYAVTSKDAVALLDDVIERMEARKEIHAGRVRTVEISTENPLEVIEFDEIGALTKYIGDRKTREQIIDRVALITTQGRALGFTMRGYVQEPTKDTVPVRDLFPRRICLRVATKSHVAMALGDNAWDRGAWANRIGESEAGVGYLFGEGIREPLRVRAGWVPDETIKALEEFVTRPAVVDGQVINLPTPAALSAGGVA